MSAIEFTEDVLSLVDTKVDGWLVKNPAAGAFRLNREAFVDEAVFELEMRHIFEGNWVFVAHESQLPKPHDFLTTYIGRKPVIITRNASGTIQCFLNQCSHKGARLCREKRGNKRTFVCSFHGWSYNSNGELIYVSDERTGGYPSTFERTALGLVAVGRVDTYRGLIFASLNPAVQPLPDYLGEATKFIDLFVNQSTSGEMEVLRGATHYIYNGNWKLQAENGLDGYHPPSVHANYVMTVNRRVAGESHNDTKVMDLSGHNRKQGGFYAFENGHAVIWIDYTNFNVRPNADQMETYIRHYGQEQTKWMLERMRNLLLFPNVFLMDQSSTQIRIIRPIAPNKTEVITYCVAPVGESATARHARIRQYEDFFNASGMATPDDLTEFNNCQMTYGGRGDASNELSRGAARWIEGADTEARILGVRPRLSGANITDEGLYVSMYEDWISRLKMAIAIEREAAP